MYFKEYSCSLRIELGPHSSLIFFHFEKSIESAHCLKRENQTMDFLVTFFKSKNLETARVLYNFWNVAKNNISCNVWINDIYMITIGEKINKLDESIKKIIIYYLLINKFDKSKIYAKILNRVYPLI